MTSDIRVSDRFQSSITTGNRDIANRKSHRQTENGSRIGAAPLPVTTTIIMSVNHPSSTVVNLLEDSSDSIEENNDVKVRQRRKRKLEEENVDAAKELLQPNNRCLVSNEASQTETSYRMETPIKLFATRKDEEQDRINAHINNNNSHDPSTHESVSQCQTLREMLLLDGEVVQPIEWLIIANYIIDFDYLLDAIPELLSVKHVLVFYGASEGNPEIWRQACHPDHTVDLVVLRPSEPANTRLNPLPFSIPYGVHHSKMFLVGFSNDTCRVVIHTANLRYGDIHQKVQAAYVQDFPTKVLSCTESSDFENTLVAYLQTYKYHRHQKWIAKGAVESVTQLMNRYDFASTKVILIPSVPGYHQLDAIESYGHWKLRKVIARFTTAPPKDDTVRAIICQFSSIGSLTEKYLRDLQISMDTGFSRTFRTKPIPPDAPLRLQLVYPTVNEIRISIEGYSGGGSVPGTN